MMHANKMILVPHELVGENESASRYMSNLDRELFSILQDNSLPIDAKVMHYNQILRRYQTARHDVEKPFQLEIREQQPNVEGLKKVETPGPSKKILDSIEETVLNTVPPKVRKQASLLLKYAQENPHIKWSERGELVVDGNKIVGSNIVDLINDFSRTRKSEPAIGADIFLKKLVEQNIPRESIVNKKRLSLLQHEVFASPDVPSPAGSSTKATPSPTSAKATPSLPLRKTVKPALAPEKKSPIRSVMGRWANLVQ